MNRKTLLYVLALTACLLCSVTAMARDAYALYRPSESKLILFYDDMLSERDEPTYELNSGSEAPEWFESRIYEDVLYVEFHESFANARPTSTYAWFLYMSKLLSIKGLEYLNTSDVTNMSYMFYGCEKLKDIDVSTFNTANVTNMYGMFYGCNRMEHLDLSGFNTANVTNMGGMFRGCTSLKTVDLRDFDTENVTKVSYMFYQCGNLTTICAGDRWNMPMSASTPTCLRVAPAWLVIRVRPMTPITPIGNMLTSTGGQAIRATSLLQVMSRRRLTSFTQPLTRR